MGIVVGLSLKSCVDDYADPPKGIPTWCVESELSFLDFVQLGLEVIGLIILGIFAFKYFRWREVKKARKEWEKRQNEGKDY